MRLKMRPLVHYLKWHIRSKSISTYQRNSTAASNLRMLSTQNEPLSERSQMADGDLVSLNPLHHEDYFGVKKMVTVKNLFDARIHYGHREGSLNDLMLPYIFGSRMGHIIFDLDKTLSLMHEAMNFAAHIAYRDGIILFVCQSPQNSHLVEETAIQCGEFAHTRYWRLGTFSNSTMVYRAVTRLPDLVIILNTLTTVLEQHWAVREAAKMAIPTIGVVDSNCDPSLITYPVPGNDDTHVAIQFYCNVFKNVILKGKAERKRVLELCKK